MNKQWNTNLESKIPLTFYIKLTTTFKNPIGYNEKSILMHFLVRVEIGTKFLKAVYSLHHYYLKWTCQLIQNCLEFLLMEFSDL